MADALSTSDAWILAAIPLAAFFVIALFHNYLWRQGDWIGVAAIFTVWVLTFFVLGNGLADYPENLPGLRSWEWMSAGDYELRIGFHVDQIALVMLVVVTTVALMVNVYSLGYMKGEVRYGWFYAVLALFAFSMIALVLADSSAKISRKLKVPKWVQTIARPIRNPASPTRLTMNALLAASPALVRSW